MENLDNRKLTCILFPGVVKNEEKAIQCLGGIRYISQVYSHSTKKRLALSYQPENKFASKIYGEGNEAAGMLLKVRVKKTKVNNVIKREVVSTAIVGRVTTMFKFESMCDFQYLPVQREGDGSIKCIADILMPSGLDDVSFMSAPAPNFIVPINFTRSDKPIKYAYTDKRYVTHPLKKNFLTKDDQVHKRVRGERSKPVVQFDFNLINDLPIEPHQDHLKIKEANWKTIKDDFETIKKLFEERPIWSQNLIKYYTKLRIPILKMIMPCLAICMKNGPWRMLWVRYGYDPRKEPGARFYQSLDFRIRNQAGINSMVMTREQVVRSKKVDQVKKIWRRTSPEELNPSEDVGESAVIFRPGMVPTQRQVFYQYCDIKIPEVEAILSQEPPPGYLCHQKRGWLPPNTDTICRDYIFKHVKQTLLATHSGPLKMEGDSSNEGSNDDDDAGSSTEEPSTSHT